MFRPPRIAVATVLAVASAARLRAQASIGTIEASSASIAGTLSLAGGEMLIGANAVITARDRTATLQLARGGEVLVCTTSALHAARGSGPTRPEPLLLALDRGAIEIHMAATASDAILTPDLRFSLAQPANGSPIAGLLDLRVRVAPNGDTCVENRGAGAPTLEVAEQFGGGLYRVRPNQHLLFEHGSLREVVDEETSPCGCPPPPVLSAADSGISTDVTRAARPGARVADDPDEVQPHTAAERQHPFPAAESQGLTTAAAGPRVPQAPPGQPHTQVAATLAFGGDGKNSDGTGSAPSAAASRLAAGAAAAKPSLAPTAAQLSPGQPLPADPSLTPAAAPPASATASAAAPPPARSTTVPAAAPAPPSPPVASSTPEPLASTAAPVNDDLASHEVAQSALPPPAPPPRTIARRVGHFFRHIFGAR